MMLLTLMLFKRSFFTLNIDNIAEQENKAGVKLHQITDHFISGHGITSMLGVYHDGSTKKGTF